MGFICTRNYFILLMRHPFLFLLVTSALTGSLCACDSKPASRASAASAAPAQSPPVKKGGESIGAGLSALNEIAKKMEALQALKPLTDDEVRQLLPAALAGRTRGPVSLTNSLGKCVSASYDKPGATIHVAVTDCAGETGAGKYMMAYDGPLAAEDSPPATAGTETLTTQKKVAFAGRQAITHHDPVNGVYSVTFLSKDRLLVFLDGEKGISLAELLAFAIPFDARLKQ